MPGLVPGIHVLRGKAEDVDGRVKPGHDGNYRRIWLSTAAVGQQSTFKPFAF